MKKSGADAPISRVVTFCGAAVAENVRLATARIAVSGFVIIIIS